MKIQKFDEWKPFEEIQNEIHHCFSNITDEYPIEFKVDISYDKIALDMGRFKYHVILGNYHSIPYSEDEYELINLIQAYQDRDRLIPYDKKFFHELVSSIKRVKDEGFKFMGINVNLYPGNPITLPLLCKRNAPHKKGITYYTERQISNMINPSLYPNCFIDEVYIYLDNTEINKNHF